MSYHKFQPGTLEYNLAVACRSVSMDGVGLGQQRIYELTGIEIKTDGIILGDWKITFERLK